MRPTERREPRGGGRRLSEQTTKRAESTPMDPRIARDRRRLLVRRAA